MPELLGRCEISLSSARPKTNKLNGKHVHEAQRVFLFIMYYVRSLQSAGEGGGGGGTQQIL